MTDLEIRIDKFLWAVRVFRTRTMAADACSKGQVTINHIPVKPSHHVKIGEIVMVKKPPIVHSYNVLKVLQNRLPAAKVKEYIEEITPDEEFYKLEVSRLQKNALRDHGTGRPTKKERRQIDKLHENF
jgi:ribosome-associated heat shock protein Hsp15